jgi:hypothetical protein
MFEFHLRKMYCNAPGYLADLKAMRAAGEGSQKLRGAHFVLENGCPKLPALQNAALSAG